MVQAKLSCPGTENSTPPSPQRFRFICSQRRFRPPPNTPATPVPRKLRPWLVQELCFLLVFTFNLGKPNICILCGSSFAMGDFSIQISGNLLNQLADDTEKPKKTKKIKPNVPRVPKPQTNVNQKEITDDSETFKGAAATGWPLQPPLFLPVNPPAQSAYTELDAIRSILQGSERVIGRLQKLEDSLAQEVTQRAKDLRDKEFKLPYQKPMPCLAENDAWLACYKEHPKDLLKCAPLVRNFESCIRRARQQVSPAE
ncbi:hypothetical protein I3760_11G145300 [Carya illinoinensis]|nr:hypothetical protein I3760_11G145300 [Carya illinoinensis]